jgi:hypothetical protein
MPELGSAAERGPVPEPGDAVLAAGQEGLAVGAVGHGPDEAAMGEGAEELVRGRVPEAGDPVLAAVRKVRPSGLKAAA